MTARIPSTGQNKYIKFLCLDIIPVSPKPRINTYFYQLPVLARTTSSFFLSPHFMASPIFHFSLLVSLSRNSDNPGPHSRLLLLLPTMVRALHVYREKTSTLCSLIDWHRIARTTYLVRSMIQNTRKRQYPTTGESFTTIQRGVTRAIPPTRYV